MSRSLIARLKHTAKRVHEVYSPEGWLQIYYPLYYLAKAIRTHVQKSRRYDGETTLTLISGAIALLLLWILWLNIRFLLQNLVKKITGKLARSTAADDQNKEEFGAHPLRSGTSAEIPNVHLETDVACGLSESEVIRRRGLYGRNEIEHSPTWLGAIRDVSVHGVSVPLEISTVLAWVLQDWLDAAVVTALLAWHVYNSLYSVKERRDLLVSLSADVNLRAAVTRESKRMDILAAELVPGDIVHIAEGNQIPADIRLLHIQEEVTVDQSAITGNPVDTNKLVDDMVYYTTGVKEGDATGVVANTAKNSFIGRTVTLVSGSSPKSEAMKDSPPYYVSEYRRVVQGVAIATIIIVLVVLALVLTVPNHTSLRPLLEVVLAIAITNLPTGRETVIQNLRASDAARLAKGQAIVNGGAIIGEALAGIDVLCTDKTGTLNTNELTMVEPHCINCSIEELLVVACFGVRMDAEGDFTDLDPIDQVFADALRAKPGAMQRWKQYKLLEFEPFNSETKMIKAVVESPEATRITSVRGAPKAILDLCRRENPDMGKEQYDYEAAARAFAREGYRTLGVARTSDEPGSNWEPLGLTPMTDATRDGTPTALKLAESLGIDVKMITGDAIAFAKTTAKSLGIDDDTEPFFAGALREYLDENEHRQLEPDIVKKASEACIFAETFPEDKEAIVKFFHGLGHRVAVTGDGVSDQPALLRADCGIAVQGASEAAQSVSDLVFLVPGIERIVEAMQVSRQILRQVQTYFIYRTVIGLHLAVVVCWSYIFHDSSPADLRWLMVNLHISDVVGMQLSEDDGGRTPFAKTPARWRIARVLLIILALAAFQVAGTALTILLTPNAADKSGITLSQQTAFLGAILSNHWLCLLILTKGRFWKYVNHWKSASMLLAMEIPTRLSYFGWAGEGGIMNAAVAVRIWLVGLGTLCACGVLCRYAAGEELVFGHVQLGENSEEKSHEDGMSLEESATSNVLTR